MALDHTPVRVLRLMASMTLALTLVAACGSDDSKTPAADEQSSSSPTDTATSTDASTEPTDDGSGDGSLGGDTCAPIEAANLSGATGVDYAVQDSDDTQCTYASAGGSVVNVTFADVSGDTGGLAFDAAKSVCDDGSQSDLTVEGAEDAYSCTAMGISQLGAIHGDVFVLVTGADILEETDANAFSDALVTILENAVAAS